VGLVGFFVFVALLQKLFSGDGAQIKTRKKEDSNWICKDCNEIFISVSRDALCPKCGANNVWPYVAGNNS